MKVENNKLIDQIGKIGFGESEHEVTEKQFFQFISENKLDRYSYNMSLCYFKDEILVAYTVHGFAHDNYFIRGYSENQRTIDFVYNLITRK